MCVCVTYLSIYLSVCLSVFGEIGPSGWEGGGGFDGMVRRYGS